MIELSGITKKYGSATAVNDVSFNARPGRVTGFLGPNGAGKSTTMRMICALTHPTSGRATVLGKAYGDIDNPGRSVGVLLDASAQHAGRTGLEVLTFSALTMGVDRACVEEMLAFVGLTPREAKRRVGHYSLGMRQRLGIANALLGDPQVLVLDEPANGLDPAGIHWMRELLKNFTDAGGTVLLSSHLLREVEAIADDIVVIGRGRIVAQGAIQDVLATESTYARAEDPPTLERALQQAGLTSVSAPCGGLVIEGQALAVGRAAAAAGVTLIELRPSGGGSLEERFLQLTAADSREGAVR